MSSTSAGDGNTATEIQYATINGVLEITVRGSPSVEDFAAALEAIRGADGYRNGRRLWDLREIDLRLSTTELRAVADHAIAGDSTPSRVAIVAPHDLDFGLARMYEAFRATDDVRVRVFRDRDPAREWVEATD